MSEAKATDYYTPDDVGDHEETERDKMLVFHGYDPEDTAHQHLSSGDLKRMWWNYKKFGKAALNND